MNNIRFLATGDIHCHEYKQFSYTLTNGLNSRFANCLKVFDILYKRAIQKKINKILLNGDLFQDSAYINTAIFNEVYKKLELFYNSKIEVIINMGNHDVVRNSDNVFLHVLTAFRKIAKVIEKPKLLWDCVQIIPWMHNEKEFKKIIKKLEPVKCLVLHQGVQDATTGPNAYLVKNKIKLEDIRYKDFNLILLSDYHNHQFLRKNVLYMGSPLQTSFGEIHKPAIWDITITDKMVSTEPIYTYLPRFRKLAIDSIAEAYEEFSKYKGDYFQIQLTDKFKADTNLIREAAKKFNCQLQIKSVSELHPTINATGGLDMVSAVKKYAKTNSKHSSKRLTKLGKRLLEQEAK